MPGSRRAAFTLLEVLAALALLGLVFTALARSGNQGIVSEGKSRRRLEASLLADATLAEIELDLARGSLPEPGVTQEEVGEFRVEVESQPWELPAELQEVAAADAGSEQQPVFADASSGATPLTREIAVRVAWDYGGEELSVERVTFAVDFAGAQAAAGTPPTLAGPTQ